MAVGPHVEHSYELKTTNTHTHTHTYTHTDTHTRADPEARAARHPNHPRSQQRGAARGGTQPTALRIISALPDCSTVLYCCQANRMT